MDMRNKPVPTCPFCNGTGLITDPEIIRLRRLREADGKPGDPVKCLCVIMAEQAKAAQP